MRVIGGRVRGRRLKMVPGDSTRPITDRVKENLFNILGDWVIGTRWLELFGGTGQVGIEALSRGASSAVFIDSQKAAVRTIADNLKHTALTADAVVMHQDAFRYLNDKPSEPFDVIYVAPPQYKGIWVEVLQELDRRPEDFLTANGEVIVQIDPKEYVDLDLRSLGLYDQRKYGRTLLCFYEVVSASVI
jgi:16S rRNA (guanine966-N2)-methyltransferase